MKVGVIDNRVEIKENVTYCQLSRLVDESNKCEEEYKPESEVESVSDADEKRR